MELNRQNMKKILGIVAFGVLLAWGLKNLSTLCGVFGLLLGLFLPFLLGGCIAFILNVPMRFIESRLFPVRPQEKKLRTSLRRPLSLILALLFVLGILFVVAFLILPGIGESVEAIRASLPGFLEQLQGWYNLLLAKLPELSQWAAGLNLDWQSIGGAVLGFLQNGAGDLVGSAVGIAASVFSGIFTGVLAFIFSLYLLLQKEKLCRQGKQLCYAFLPERVADRCIATLRLANSAFSNFLSGQCTEAVILGVLFFVCMWVLRFPYALMISVLIAALSLVPIFGATVGCIVGALLIFMSSPVQAFWFVVLFLVLQQIEGNLIYPRVVGGSVGLPSIWVLVAVTLGGSTMGVAGMLIFIPLCSVLYALLRQVVYRRLQQRQIAAQKYDTPPGGDGGAK